MVVTLGYTAIVPSQTAAVRPSLGSCYPHFRRRRKTGQKINFVNFTGPVRLKGMIW